MKSNAALKLDDEPLPPTLMTGGGDGGDEEDSEPAPEGRLILAGNRFKLGWFMHLRRKRRRRLAKSTAVQLTFDF